MNNNQTNRRQLALLLICCIVLFCIGIGIGFVIGKDKYDKENKIEIVPLSLKQMEEGRFEHHKRIMDQMKADNIKKNLKNLTTLPHWPGSVHSQKLAEEMAANWKAQGFDKTELFKYNIYLSFPERPAEFLLWNGSTIQQKLVIYNEPSFDESEKKGKVLYPYNAFSAGGVVTGELVYGNYGRDSDFTAVKGAGIDVSGKIMIFRYGKTSRSQKVRRSEARGCVGVIIYSDPSDYTYPGQEYPNGWMLNKYAVQRGTVNRLTGDALSNGYPSKDNYFRINETKYSGNPAIPSQPISYSTAYEILRWMNNDTIPLPSGFQGGLNFSYPLYSGAGRNITLNVSAKFETKPSYTVCGTLYGSEEPDRYILLGNHRDAWTYGGTDPSSGTATMLEIVRVLGEYQKQNDWRPQRSIMVCSWGTEESGIQGSTEWADENHQFLMDKVAIYINVDMAVEGNFTMRLKALDSISEGIFNTAKNVPAADDPSKTLYEDWRQKSALLKNVSQESMKKPTVYNILTSGSDYKALWHTYGTPSADLRYLFSKIDYPKLPLTPQYHTLYESFGWMSKYVDPKFVYHLTVGKLWVGYALTVADSIVIPYDLVAFSKQVKNYLKRFENKYKTLLEPKGISLEYTEKLLNALTLKAEKFHAQINKLTDENMRPYKLRSINDKIMNFERNFIIPGLVNQTTSARHVIYSTIYDQIFNEKFPGISEAILYAYKDASNDWDDVRKQVTIVNWCLDTAMRSLELNE